jgi:hypothetical protein
MVPGADETEAPVEAPPPGDGVDDGICGGVTVGRTFQRGKEERDEAGEMQKVTRSTLGWSERPGKARSGRGLRRSAVAVAGERRSRHRYEAPGLDSFRQVEEESEADVLVGLDGRGTSGRRRYCGGDQGSRGFTRDRVRDAWAVPGLIGLIPLSPYRTGLMKLLLRGSNVISPIPLEMLRNSQKKKKT